MQGYRIRYRIASGEVLPLVDERTTHQGMWIRTAPPNRREVISATKGLKQRKAAGLEALPTEVSSEVLLPCVRENWEFDTPPSELNPRPFLESGRKG